MIDASILLAMKPIERNQSEVRERLIGIDGNGSGRIGALQRQDKKLELMDSKIDAIDGNVAALLTNSSFWNKAKIRSGLSNAAIIIIALLALIVSYLAYRASEHIRGVADTPKSQSYNDTTVR